MTESQQASPATPVAAATSTAWTSSGRTPLRNFLRTETGSATILAGATLAALIWWQRRGRQLRPSSGRQALTASADGHGMSMSLREFVNSGLMALFFLVVGLGRPHSGTWASCGCAAG